MAYCQTIPRERQLVVANRSVVVDISVGVYQQRVGDYAVASHRVEYYYSAVDNVVGGGECDTAESPGKLVLDDGVANGGIAHGVDDEV